MHSYFNRRYTPVGDPDSFTRALAQWRGDETIGFLMTCAGTRVPVLYNELRKQPSGTLQNLFQGLWESRTDPLTASSDREVQRIWEKLDDAILEARRCVFEVTSRYGEQEALLYYHAAEVLFALEEVKRQIRGDRDPLLDAAMR